MTGTALEYAVITPVRNDEQNLRALAGALSEQTVKPQHWIIADTGSDDGTQAAAHEIASQHAWISVLDVRTDTGLMRGAPIVRAFHAGLEKLDRAPDVVVKLDADITFDTDHFESLLSEFQSNPKLGIAGGMCYEQSTDGNWRQRHGTGAAVWGANRGYQWSCLQAILPLEERMGWDTLDLVKAAVRGWEVALVQDLPFWHHRPEGKRDGRRARTWAIQGGAAHYMGYRLSYMMVRTLYRSLQEPSALALVYGYASAAIRREPTCADEDVRAYLRREQSLRRLPLRIREARRPREALAATVTNAPEKKV